VVQALGKVIFFISILAASTLFARPISDSANDNLSFSEFSTLLDQIVATMQKDGAKVGVAVSSIKTGEMLTERGAGLALNPASNVKIVSSVAALHILKPEFRFKTEYYATGPIRDGVLAGDLIVKGYGDPTVVNERLESVAHNLHFLGIQKITGRIVYDDSYFDGDLKAKGFREERKSFKAYAAPVGALSLNHNTIAIYVRPTECGSPALVATDPQTDYVDLKGSVKTTCKRNRFGIFDHESNGRMAIFVSGQVKGNVPAQRNIRSIYDPSRYFAATLAQDLRQAGIAVTGEISHGLVPRSAKLLEVDQSPPLSEVVNEMNKFSNNFMAEMLVKAVGAHLALPGTFANGLVEIRKFLENRVGFQRGEYVLGNGSGLNEVNRFSAKQIVQLLTYAYKDFSIASEFVSSLAIAGTQGTIRKRMRDAATYGLLRAKTGTEHGISALSGYVPTKDHDVLAFSILVDGHRAPLRSILALEDRICGALAKVRVAKAPGLAAVRLKTDSGS